MYKSQREVRKVRRALVVAASTAVMVAGLTLSSAQLAAADVGNPYPGGQDVDPPGYALIGGYMSSGNPNFANWDMKNVNFALWAFSTIGEPGQANDGECTPATAAGLQSVSTFRAANPGTKIIRSIGGWGGRGFTYAVRTQEGREKLARTCIEKFLDTNAADGFDFDWEFPVSGGPPYIGADPSDRENHNLMVIEFRKQMNEWAKAHNVDPDELWLTAAIPAGRWQDDGTGTDTGAPYDVTKSFDLEFLGRTLNMINIMTYEMGTGYVPVSMPNQPLYRDPKDNTGDPYNSGVDMVRLFMEQGVPANKIAWGVMFTGSRGFVVGSTENGGMWQPWTATGCGSGATAVNWAAAQNDARNVLVYWDDVTKNQWLFDPEQKRVCSFESPQTIGLRAKWAKENGLGGFYSWTLNNTSGSNFAELRAAAREFYPEWIDEPDAPTVEGKRFFPVKGQEFSGEIARVKGSAATSLTAVINWGDLTRSTATVVNLGNGEWSVRGSHVYAKPGNYELTVATIDPMPINSVSANAWASVGTVASVDENLVVGVQPGSLALTVPKNQTVDFGDVTANAVDQYVTAQMNYALVTDARGTDEGWTLSASATNFVGDTQPKRILANNLGWHPWATALPVADALVHDGDAVSTVTAGADVAPGQAAGLAVPKGLCTGAVGASTGKYQCGATLELGIPWDTAADRYTSVLTLTLM